MIGYLSQKIDAYQSSNKSDEKFRFYKIGHMLVQFYIAHVCVVQ